LGLLAAGCTVFSSDSLVRPVNGESSAVGLSYTLPKGIIRGKLVVDAARAEFVMCLLARPVPVADPRHQYYMPFNNNPFSADQYTILKDDTTGRLISIRVRTVDRFNEFALNLGKSVGAVTRAFRQEGAQIGAGLCNSRGGTGVVVLATLDFDPADQRRTQQELVAVNAVMLRFARQKSELCSQRRAMVAKIVKAQGPKKAPTPKNGTQDAMKAADDLLQADEACREYDRIAYDYSETRPPIEMSWVLPGGRYPVKPDCSAGFCYRHTLPHTVQLRMAGGSMHSYTYQLPNASPIVAMDITRAITVTKTTEIDFGELGQINKIFMRKGNEDGSKGSEAEGLALLPVTVVNAYFQGMQETAKLIAGTFTEEKGVLESKKARDAAALEALEKQRELAVKIKQEGSSPIEEYAVVASNGVPPTKVDFAQHEEDPPEDKQAKDKNKEGQGGPTGPGTSANP
jgi:hypothetical protein